MSSYHTIIKFFAYWADPEESTVDKIAHGLVSFIIFAGSVLIGFILVAAMVQFFPWAELILLGITIVIFGLIYLCKWAYKVQNR